MKRNRDSEFRTDYILAFMALKTRFQTWKAGFFDKDCFRIVAEYRNMNYAL